MSTLALEHIDIDHIDQVTVAYIMRRSKSGKGYELKGKATSRGLRRVKHGNCDLLPNKRQQLPLAPEITVREPHLGIPVPPWESCAFTTGHFPSKERPMSFQL